MSAHSSKPPRGGKNRKRATSEHVSRYHHGDLRRALLAAAQSVLDDLGLQGFTLRECARRAGVSHGAPAHHFGDVRGLLSALTAESFEQLEALMLGYRAEAEDEPFAQLLAIGLAYGDYAIANRARFQLMFRSDQLDRNDAALQVAGAAVYGQLVDCIERTSAAAGAPGVRLQEKIALAWTIVHGFAMLMIDNRLFADQAAGDPQRARALLHTLIEMSRPAYELRSLPESAAQARRRAGTKRY